MFLTKDIQSTQEYFNQENDLFGFSPEKEQHLKTLSTLVKKEGLESLYEQLNSIPLEDKLLLDNNDLLSIASHDDRIGHTIQEIDKTQIKNQIRNVTNKVAYQKHDLIKEVNGSGMDYLTGYPFESWENSINNIPKFTFFPKSSQGLKHLIRFSNNNMRLRASGYRHTSSDMYSQNEEVLVSMLNLETSNKLPAEYPKMNPYSDLQGIQLIGEPYESNGTTKILCEIGSQTCNYHFQDWVHAVDGGNSAYTLPLNVIMVENTFGGTNAMICHGAGIKNKTISDLIREIKFINVNGEEQIVNDKEQIKAAAGCFGLLGLVTSLTFELDKMTYGNLKTSEKKLLVLTVPPQIGTKPSSQLKKHLNKQNLSAMENQGEINQAIQEFAANCEDSYYAEFFWFPLHDQGWANCWKNNGDQAKSVRYPGTSMANVEKAGSYLAYLADNALGDHAPALIKKIQTKLFSTVAMSILPDKKDLVCSVEDLIHFEDGIQNFKTRMVEFEIPITNLANGKPDWSICQQAWWTVIESVYSDYNMEHFPMRTALEMRIMGGSDMIMAAQYGNELTCSIEILTPVAININIWDKFVQDILDKWAMLTDENGRYLNIRPHWAKRFDHLFIRRDKSWLKEWDDEQTELLKKYVNENENIISIPMREYLKYIAYKEQIPKFIQQIQSICKHGGYQFEDILQRFSNPLLADLMSGAKIKQNMPQEPRTSLISAPTFFQKKIINKPDKKQKQTILGESEDMDANGSFNAKNKPKPTPCMSRCSCL